MTRSIQLLIPNVIKTLDRDKPWCNWLPGTVLFSDVSGFTPMSEALAVQGAVGAEILTEILNRYFKSMIDIIHAHGGQIMKFGGDAILCFFEGNKSLHPATRAAIEMQQQMKNFSSIQTPVKRFSLKMKIGIAFGDVLIAGVGDPAVRCDYVFAGKAVDLTSDAEHHATSGEIVYAGLHEDIEQFPCDYETITPGFHKIISARPYHQQEPLPSGQSAVDTALSSYLIREISEMIDSGFEEHIGSLIGTVIAFVSFSGFHYTRREFDLEEFNAFFSHVLAITAKYQGNLNRISMGDKGSTFLILFGAPAALEKKELYALGWAREVLATITRRFPRISLKFGLNSGKIFSGMVGGSKRFEFTVMGDAVNFAARLMQGAANSQIVVSEGMKRAGQAQFNFTFLGDRSFKGKKKPLPVYSLQGRISSMVWERSNVVLLGREHELEVLQNHLDNAGEQKPSVVFLEGNAGSGKSILAHSFLQKNQGNWLIFSGHGDITRQRLAYSPWLECLQQWFFDDAMNFNQDAVQLLSQKVGLSNEESTVLAGFFFTDLSIQQHYNGETQRIFMQHVVSKVIVELTENEKTILFFEDFHRFDSLSIELLATLISHLNSGSLMIILTSRPHEHIDKLEQRTSCHILPVRNFSEQQVSTLAGQQLGASPRSDLVQLIVEHTRGNAFFTINFLAYLQKEKLLEKRLGYLVLKRGSSIDETITSDDLITAHLKELSARELVLLRTIACIGTEFPLAFLKYVLDNDFHESSWMDLVSKGFFLQHDRGNFIFQHAIVQDSVYHSIPQKIRTKIHGKIGRALEHFYQSNLSQKLPTIAEHYHLARNRKKTLAFSIAAGSKLNGQMLFVEAASYYQMAHSLLKMSSDERKWGVALQLSRLYLHLGKLNEGLKLLKSLQKSARRKDKQDILMDCLLLTVQFQQRLSDYSYVNTLIGLVNSPEVAKNQMYFQMRNYIGQALYRKGQMDAAEREFTITISELPPDDGAELLIASYKWLFAISKGRRDYEKAYQTNNEAIKLAADNRMIYLKLQLEINNFLLVVDQRKHAQAQMLHYELLKKCEECGDMYHYGAVLLAMGKMCVDQAQFDRAKEYLDEALIIYKNSDAMSAQAVAYQYLGVIAFYRRQFRDAYNSYRKALDMFLHADEIHEAQCVYYNIGEVCLMMGEHDEAQQWLEKLREYAAPGQSECTDFYCYELEKLLKQK